MIPTATRRRLGRTAVALSLLAMTGVQLVDVTATSASTVTNPAHATTTHGRFTDTIVLDNGVVTVTPAPASTAMFQSRNAATNKIWSSTEFSGFAPQTVGYGYVTVKGTPHGETPVSHLLAWVGFANGNTSGVCAKSKKGKYRTNGEAAVVLGDAASSPAVAYVPSGCGIAGREGYTVPSEVVSVPWVKTGTPSAKGVVNFATAAAQCGSVYGTTRALSKSVIEVQLLDQRPDWSAQTCTASVVTLGMPIATTAARADAIRLVHATLGAVRQVVGEP